jgi:hypothetical protein
MKQTRKRGLQNAKGGGGADGYSKKLRTRFLLKSRCILTKANEKKGGIDTLHGAST